MRGDRRHDTGQTCGALDALPRVACRYRKDAIISVFFSSQRLQPSPYPAREPHDPRLAALTGDVRDAVDEICADADSRVRIPATCRYRVVG